MTKSEDLLIGMLVGGCIGAAITLLVTPVSGTNLRHEILNGFNGVEHKKKAPSRPARRTPKPAAKKA